MAFDEGLAQRIREVLADQPGLVEKKMFGGVGFMLQGNMACGVNKNDLVVRVGPEKYEAAVIRPQARPFDITGRPMKGWVMVDGSRWEDPDELETWLTTGRDFALTLPAK